MSYNIVMLIGNVGADPEVRATQSGTRVASLRLATSEQWKDKATGEKRENTEWHQVVVFGDGLVRVVENYVSKGSKIFVSGQLRTRKWQDKDGNDRYTTEVVLSGPKADLRLLDSPRKSGETKAPSAPAAEQDDLDDEIPF